MQRADDDAHTLTVSRQLTPDWLVPQGGAEAAVSPWRVQVALAPSQPLTLTF